MSRFHARGVFWRQFIRWAAINVPIWIEPVVIGSWALFFLLFGAGRRGVLRNLSAIKPQSWSFVNLLRAYRVFWNFAWTLNDTIRFHELRIVPDWEFIGLEYLEELSTRPGGAIILTAHMGNYDLGAHVFSETSNRRMVMVRAPEVDPETRAFEERLQEKSRSEALRIDFNVKASELALDLLHALQDGELVAVQGDRVTPGISAIEATLFGKRLAVPAGPFALAMAARVPIYPLFIVRAGRRRYQLVTRAPIHVERRGQRNQDLRRAVDAWATQLEEVVREDWHQWFAFEEFSEDLVA